MEVPRSELGPNLATKKVENRDRVPSMPRLGLSPANIQ